MTLRGRAVPVSALIFVLALTASGAVLAATVSILRVTGHVAVPVTEVLLAGLPASTVLAVIATVANVQTARAVQRVQARARTVDALQRRIRLADEVAEKHRRTAENASAGMFELLSGLVAAEEGARGQLSAELHDTVAQSLMTAQVLLSDLDDRVNVERAGALIAEAEEQVRSVMARTTPPALRDGDLAHAVSALRDDLLNRYALVVDLSWPTEAYPLPLVTAVTVYRFFQEGLLNVVKHADVDAARAQLWVDESWVVATVIDEGPGFELTEVHSEGGRHVGLGLLRERARLAAGAVEVVSRVGAGTTLTLRLPRVGSSSTSVLPLPLPVPAALEASVPDGSYDEAPDLTNDALVADVSPVDPFSSERLPAPVRPTAQPTARIPLPTETILPGTALPPLVAAPFTGSVG